MHAPSILHALDALQDHSLQTNTLSGTLSSFRGMAALRHTCLNGNAFDAFLAEFFNSLADGDLILTSALPLIFSTAFYECIWSVLFI
jgi:hypothetical protein